MNGSLWGTTLLKPVLVSKGGGCSGPVGSGVWEDLHPACWTGWSLSVTPQALHGAGRSLPSEAVQPSL